MKCPSCGYWNKSEFPRCFRCGAPLSPPAQEPADRPWEQSLRDAEPDVSYERYDDDENAPPRSSVRGRRSPTMRRRRKRSLWRSGARAKSAPTPAQCRGATCRRRRSPSAMA